MFGMFGTLSVGISGCRDLPGNDAAQCVDGSLDRFFVCAGEAFRDEDVAVDSPQKRRAGGLMKSLAEGLPPPCCRQRKLVDLSGRVHLAQAAQGAEAVLQKSCGSHLVGTLIRQIAPETELTGKADRGA